MPNARNSAAAPSLKMRQASGASQPPPTEAPSSRIARYAAPCALCLHGVFQPLAAGHCPTGKPGPQAQNASIAERHASTTIPRRPSDRCRRAAGSDGRPSNRLPSNMRTGVRPGHAAGHVSFCEPGARRLQAGLNDFLHPRRRGSFRIWDAPASGNRNPSRSLANSR